MLSFIRYTPNREADLLAFMEKYQKADCEERPAVLEQLRSCMDGKEYPDPYAGSYHYAPEDVSLMEKKDADLEQELCDSLQKLYEKYVPSSVREYIDEGCEDAPAATSFKKQKEKEKAAAAADGTQNGAAH